MATITTNTNRERATQSILGAVAVLTVLLCATYYVTFYGSSAVQTQINSIAFADTGHYVELLDQGHYSKCLAMEQPDRIEHRRKTLHHLGFVAIGDVIVNVGKTVFRLDELSAIWLVAPVLGALNFVLAFFCFRGEAGDRLAMPAALTYSLVPATWIYASIPETWILSGTAVMSVLLMRRSRLSPWSVALMIAVFALNNFLLLSLVALLWEERRPLLDRTLQLIGYGTLALSVWMLLLAVLGLTLSPDFQPAAFLDYTIRFKGILGENLSIVHPGRWAYTGINGWLAPFVLNQSYLNFGRYAVMDSAAVWPLGTLSVATLAVAVVSVVVNQYRRIVANLKANESVIDQISGTGIYLLLVFIATGLALYYESFLYSQMILPILLLLLLGAMPRTRGGVAMMWWCAVVWGLNALQQVLVFRQALGQ